MRDWAGLEHYMVPFLPAPPGEDIATAHPGLIIHRRIGMLIDLKGSGASKTELIAFFQRWIFPLKASGSKYARLEQIKEKIDKIGAAIENETEGTLDSLDARFLKLIFHDYMRIYFPHIIRFHRDFAVQSPYWRFMTRDEIDRTKGASTVRCFLCHEILRIMYGSVKMTVDVHWKSCQGVTPRALELLDSANKKSRKGVRTTLSEGVQMGRSPLSASRKRKPAEGIRPRSQVSLGQRSSSGGDRPVDLMAGHAQRCFELGFQFHTLFSKEMDADAFNELAGQVFQGLLSIWRYLEIVLKDPVMQSVNTAEIKRSTSGAMKILSDLSESYYFTKNSSVATDLSRLLCNIMLSSRACILPASGSHSTPSGSRLTPVHQHEQSGAVLPHPAPPSLYHQQRTSSPQVGVAASSSSYHQQGLPSFTPVQQHEQSGAVLPHPAPPSLYHQQKTSSPQVGVAASSSLYHQQGLPLTPAGQYSFLETPVGLGTFPHGNILGGQQASGPSNVPSDPVLLDLMAGNMLLGAQGIAGPPNDFQSLQHPMLAELPVFNNQSADPMLGAQQGSGTSNAPSEQVGAEERSGPPNDVQSQQAQVSSDQIGNLTDLADFPGFDDPFDGRF